MALSIEYYEEAKVILRKLDPSTAERIVSKIRQAAENPRHFFERLTGSDFSKLRVGDYRVIAKLDFSASKVGVVTIGHRKNVYDRL